jgi:predicted transcriptional regulator
VDLAVRRLEESPAVIVLDNGHPVGVITRSDALSFLAQTGSVRDAAR